MIGHHALACSLVFLAFAAADVNAAPGDLDPTFGSGGAALGSVSAEAKAVVRQPDGKLVVAGRRNSSPFHLVVERWIADGTPDATFGTGGVVQTIVPAGDSNAFAVALQSDGKIVVAGSVGSGPSNGDFLLIRYEADGTLDATFGAGGIVIAGGPTNEIARSLVIQADGKLVAAGEMWNGTAYVFALARFASDGTLDTGFGTGGWVTGPGTQAQAILQQPDGKLVVAGYKIVVNRDFALVRYGTDGTPDATFGTGGLVTTSLSFYHDQAYGLVRQADGGFVVAGYTGQVANVAQSLVLMRYDASGTLDPSFGTGGISARVPVLGSGSPFQKEIGLVEQPDGKLVVASHNADANPVEVLVARWDSDGTVDAGFGNAGVASARVPGAGSGHHFGQAALLQPDGRVVVAGNASNRMFVARFDTGLCCTGGPCSECGSCETCGLAGCEPTSAGSTCPDDGSLCTTDACDGAGTCLHTPEPAPVCDEPTVAGGAQLKIQASDQPGKDRVQFKWRKGTPTHPADPYEMRLCVYDRSASAYTIAYEGSPVWSTDSYWTYNGTATISLKFKSDSGDPNGIKRVNLKLSSPPSKTQGQMKAAGDLALGPMPLQHDPSVVAQMRWTSGQCWGATFSLPIKSDAAKFNAKSD